MSTVSPKKSKYARVAQHLRQQIETGELRPGDRLPSILEMCTQHGVSRPVIERIHSVLEQDGLVERKPYRGVFVASARPTKRTNVIGFLGFGFHLQPRTSYWADLMSGIREVARREGRHVLILEDVPENIEELADGLLLTDLAAADHVRALPLDFPCVTLLQAVRGRASILADDYTAGQEATEYLLGLGHRRIASIEISDSITRRRVSGYRDSLEDAGIAFDSRWGRRFGELTFPVPNFEERSEAIMAQWLQEDWDELGCTAILAQNDLIGKGVMRALQAAGKQVPRDVSVIGFDGSDFCEHLSPKLTSVAIPLQDIGALGTELLIRQIAGEPVLAANFMLPPRLDVRDSTGPA